MRKLLSLVVVASFLSMNAEDQCQLESKACLQAAHTCFHAFITGMIFLTAYDYEYFNAVNNVPTSNKFLRFVQNNGPRAAKIVALVAFPVLEYCARKRNLEQKRSELAELKRKYDNKSANVQKLVDEGAKIQEVKKRGWFGY